MKILKVLSFKKIKELLKNPEELKKVYEKHKEIIKYIFFGLLATIVSFVTYYIFRIMFPNKESTPPSFQFIYKLSGLFGADSNTALPVILSWIITVTFAYVTNRVFVFAVKAKGFLKILKEVFFFFSARLFTLVVDMMIMYFLIDFPGIYNFIYEFFVKSFCAFVVTLLNYFLSKFIIFRKKS